MTHHHFLTRCGLWTLLLGVASVLGCTAPSPPATYTDDLGRAVALPPQPQRIVTLAPNLTEIVHAAGAGDQLVGISTVDQYPPDLLHLPRFSLFPINFEAVTALNPELAFATDQVNRIEDADALASLDIPTVFFRFDQLDDIFSAIEKAGTLLGTEAVAQSKATSLRQRLLNVRAMTDTLQARPKTLLLVGDSTLYAFGRDSYTDLMVRYAGGQNLTAVFEGQSALLSEEFVLTEKPEVIIGGFGTDYDVRRLLALHPTWDVLPAIRDGRVYSLDPDLLLRPGPRVVDAVEQMVRLIHPAFSSPQSPAP